MVCLWQEEAHIYDAINGRSYDQFNRDKAIYLSKKLAGKPTEVREDEARSCMDHKFDYSTSPLNYLSYLQVLIYLFIDTLLLFTYLQMIW